MTLAEDKKRFQFATPGPATPLHWKYLLGTGCPTQIEKTACDLPLRGASLATSLRHPASSLRKALVALLRICGPYSVAPFFATLAQHGTYLIYSRIASSTPRRLCNFTGLIKPAVGLDPVQSSTRLAHLYIIFWHTLHLCNIPVHHVSSFYHNTLCIGSLWYILRYHACGRCDTELSTARPAQPLIRPTNPP